MAVGAPAAAGPGESDGIARTSRAFEPLLVGLVPSLLGLVAYAVVREGYVWMYERYGLSPEDVGIGQLQMASEMIRIVHLWVLDIPRSPATNFAIVFGFLALILAAGRRLRRRWRWLDDLATRHPIALGLSVLLAIVILTSGWAVPRDRDFAGRKLQLGRAVHPTQLAVLAIEADPARVTWTGGRRPPRELLTSSSSTSARPTACWPCTSRPTGGPAPSTTAAARFGRSARATCCCAWRSTLPTGTRPSHPPTVGVSGRAQARYAGLLIGVRSDGIGPDGLLWTFVYERRNVLNMADQAERSTQVGRQSGLVQPAGDLLDTTREALGYAVWGLMALVIAVFELWAVVGAPPWPTISATVGHLEAKWGLVALVVVALIVVVADQTSRSARADRKERMRPKTGRYTRDPAPTVADG